MNLKYKTKPYPHQVRALRKLLHNRGGGLQVPMRWGKSWVGINFSGAMYHIEDVRKVLVVTVTSGLGVWEAQVAEHCPVPWATRVYKAKQVSETADAVDGSLYKFSEETETDYLTFWIVNFQNLYQRDRDPKRGEWLPAPNAELLAYDADIVIVDESHHIGDPSAVQSVEARRLGRKARFRVFMTGSMFHRRPFFVFGQAKFFDDGTALGSSYTQYKKRIAVMGGYGGYEILKYRNLKWMIERLKPSVYMEKYVPPGKAVHNVIHFDLTGRTLQFYSAMASKGIVTYRGKRSLAPIILTKHLRLLELCGGHLAFEDERTRVGQDKLTMCADRLKEYREQDIHKAVIGCRFLPELAELARLAKTLGFLPVLFHGGVPKGDERSRRVALFQETNKRALFISQIAAGKESIDLSAASVMMYYSLTESYVAHDQFSKRIEKFKDTRTLMYDYMIGRGTLEAVNLAALEMNEDLAKYIVTHPERVEALTTLENRKKVAA